MPYAISADDYILIAHNTISYPHAKYAAFIVSGTDSR
jgi:hypothetical protein